jgi:hypothetical protein
MDITDKILAELQDENQSDRLQLDDLIDYLQYSVLHLDPSDMTEVENELMISQYAYIKLGLILEKVRNQCMWKKCLEKFSDFRSFCQRKVNLNIWQATNAIKSAQVAVKLSFLGFTELPRNASQALKMADLSIERLGEVWGNVIKSCAGHKITALAIDSQIDPDKVAANSTLKLPTAVVDGLARQAIEHGLTLKEYLKRLANGEDLDDESSQVQAEVTEEMTEIVDALDLQFQAQAQSKVSIEPKKIIEHAIDSFDQLMENLIGQFIPKVRVVVNE